MSRYRDTKGYSLTPAYYDGPGVLLDDGILREELEEIADSLKRSFPESPVSDRVQQILSKTALLREQLLEEWDAMKEVLHYAGYQLENNVTDLSDCQDVTRAVHALGPMTRKVLP